MNLLIGVILIISFDFNNNLLAQEREEKDQKKIKRIEKKRIKQAEKKLNKIGQNVKIKPHKKKKKDVFSKRKGKRNVKKKNTSNTIEKNVRLKPMNSDRQLRKVGQNVKVKSLKKNAKKLDLNKHYARVKILKRKKYLFNNLLHNILGTLSKKKTKHRKLALKNTVRINRKYPSSATKHVGEYVLKAPKKSLREISNEYQNVTLDNRAKRNAYSTPFYKKDWKHPSYHYWKMKYIGNENRKKIYRKVRILRNRLKPNAIHPKYLRDGHKSKSRYDAKESKIWYH